MMTHDDAFARLEPLGLFDTVDPSLRDDLVELFLKAGRIESHEAGAVLLHEGDVGGDVGYVVLQGTVRVTRESGGALILTGPVLLGEMRQFNPSGTRTATVTTVGPCTVLRFGWMPLYLEARMSLHELAQTQLQDAIELVVWERFHQDALLAAPVFDGMTDAERLKFCLTLFWISRRQACNPGELLFDQDTPQGGAGYLLMRGGVALSRNGQRIGELEAPDIAGLTPDFDPDRKWTASGAATVPLVALRFDWNELEVYLTQRATAVGSSVIMDILRKNAEGRFTH
ncbi:MAG: cyclic nucleotide-binding domain-containing protein [Candidatus Hydrogenedens sp.]|nr:cyclic nucleotide-binding domain-containing protein [Candidatus Hydrogenedens sp.]